MARIQLIIASVGLIILSCGPASAIKGPPDLGEGASLPAAMEEDESNAPLADLPESPADSPSASSPIPDPSALDLLPNVLGALGGWALATCSSTGCSLGVTCISLGSALSGFNGGSMPCLLFGVCSFLGCAIPLHSWSGALVSGAALSGACLGQVALTERSVWPVVLGALPGVFLAVGAGALSTGATLLGVQSILSGAAEDIVPGAAALAAGATILMWLAGPTSVLGSIFADAIFGSPEEPAHFIEENAPDLTSSAIVDPHGLILPELILPERVSCAQRGQKKTLAPCLDPQPVRF
jgi:hypothetical protein